MAILRNTNQSAIYHKLSVTMNYFVEDFIYTKSYIYIYINFNELSLAQRNYESS